MSEKESIDVLWILLCTGLVFLMQGGFLCLETGVTRAKNNINVAIKNLTDFGISFMTFWLIGFAIMFGRSGLTLAFSKDIALDFDAMSAWMTAFFLYQAMFCGTSVTILSGAVAERMRFRAYFLAAAIVSTLIYPMFGRWAWNGLDVGESLGWLGSQGFVDFAGSTVVHSTGGWVALAALLVIGPRAGRFRKEGSPARIPRSNLPVATLGVVLLWLGWMGFNGGSLLALTDQVPLIISNTMLGGAAGLLGALVVGRIVTGKTDVELAMNGSLAGLVSVTANCFAISATSAVAIGTIGGMVMVAVVYLLEHLHIDDAVGAIPVHLGAGIWGTLAVALFGNAEVLETGLSFGGQLKVQCLGIVTCFVWAFGIPYVLFRVINRFFPLRVDPEDEYIGLNISEHGERTDLIDLFSVMDDQSRTGDLTLRAPVEPFTEVGRIANRYNGLMGSLEIAQQHLEKTTAAKERMESELRIGREIQMSMLPLMLPPFPDRKEFSIFAALQPAREVGGDFYDFFFIDENQLCFCIGDVSGKGVPAALFMAVSKTLIKSCASDDFSSASVLTCVNKELSAENESSMFVTVFLGILDVKTGEVVYTNAGHNPPYIKRADGKLECLDSRHGVVVGVLEGHTYQEERTTLDKGDTLFLYTDGLTEAINLEGKFYTQNRLSELIMERAYQSAEDVVQSAVRSIHNFVGSADQSDDVTVMSVQFLGQPEKKNVAEILQMTVKNSIPEIDRVNRIFNSVAEKFSLSYEVIQRMHVVFDEVLSNVIAYAYRDNKEHDIEINVQLADDRITVTISDDGIPFNPFRFASPDTKESVEKRAIGGMGIHLVRNLMSKVSYQRRVDRNVLSLVKYLNAESG